MRKSVVNIPSMVATRSIPLAVNVLVFSALSFLRSAVYDTEVTLYADIVAKSPQKARPHNILGNALREMHRFAEAQAQLELAIALNNLGAVYNSIGRRQEGLALLQRALQLDPGNLQARSNVALQYFENGMVSQAEQEYQTIIRIAPRSKEAIFAMNMLAMIERSCGSR